MARQCISVFGHYEDLLAEFQRTRQNESPRHSAGGFWKRPVPLYVAAAAILILVGLSFAAGRSTSRPQSNAGSEEPRQGPMTTTSVDIKWVAAENDLL